jgi:hypothetical protein
MKEPLFIITGLSSLTGYRDQISRPMPEQMARERLQRELDNRKYQKHPAYKRLKLERYEAVQLTIKWEEETWS